MEKNPNAKVVKMVTVYNDVSNGPSLQTFKFRQYDLLICMYLSNSKGLLTYIGWDLIVGTDIRKRDV